MASIDLDKTLSAFRGFSTANLPLDHDGGTITLSETGSGTRVLWRSTFTVPVAVAGPALGAVLAAAIKRGFVRLLDDIERLAASP